MIFCFTRIFEKDIKLIESQNNGEISDIDISLISNDEFLKSQQLKSPIIYRRNILPLPYSVIYHVSINDNFITQIHYSWLAGIIYKDKLTNIFNSNCDLITNYFNNKGFVFEQENNFGNGLSKLKMINWENEFIEVKQGLSQNDEFYLLTVYVIWK